MTPTVTLSAARALPAKRIGAAARANKTNFSGVSLRIAFSLVPCPEYAVIADAATPILCKIYVTQYGRRRNRRIATNWRRLRVRSPDGADGSAKKRRPLAQSGTTVPAFRLRFMRA